MGQGITFPQGSKDNPSGKMPAAPANAPRQGQGPIVMAGNGDKDTKGVIADPKCGGGPKGSGITFVKGSTA